jgi:hypothetical protein
MNDRKITGGDVGQDDGKEERLCAVVASLWDQAHERPEAVSRRLRTTAIEGLSADELHEGIQHLYMLRRLFPPCDHRERMKLVTDRLVEEKHRRTA